MRFRCRCGCKPQRRYVRLANSVFSRDPQDPHGLISANMQKLTFFALTTPHKLSNIGKHLEQRMVKAISKRQYGYINTSVRAIVLLMQACQSNLGLFVDSLLMMIEILLESQDSSLHVLGSETFILFTQIQENALSYNRKYDFFLTRFSQLCWVEIDDPLLHNSVRIAGLKGLHAALHKMLDERGVSPVKHYDMVIPALVENLREINNNTIGRLNAPEATEHVLAGRPLRQSTVGDTEDVATICSPYKLAEIILRYLARRNSFGSSFSTVQPVLDCIDSSNSWVPNTFVTELICIIMYSTQPQYYYIPIAEMLQRLDDSINEPALIKTSMIEVLSLAVAIAQGAVGPSVLEVFNTLIRHLLISVNNTETADIDVDAQRPFQDAIIEAIRTFTHFLPPYQKLEAMIFIIGKLPGQQTMVEVKLNSLRDVSTDIDESPLMIPQQMLMKCVLAIAHTYMKSDGLENTFPSALIDPLLKSILCPCPVMRDLALQVLRALLDFRDPEHVSEQIKAAVEAFNSIPILRKMDCSETTEIDEENRSLSPRSISRYCLETIRDGLYNLSDHPLPYHSDKNHALFLNRHSTALHYTIVYYALMEGNTSSNIASLLATCCILVSEFGYTEVLELASSLLCLQAIVSNTVQLPDNNGPISNTVVAQGHAFIAMAFGVLAVLTDNDVLLALGKRVVRARIMRPDGDVFRMTSELIVSTLKCTPELIQPLVLLLASVEDIDEMNISNDSDCLFSQHEIVTALEHDKIICQHFEDSLAALAVSGFFNRHLRHRLVKSSTHITPHDSGGDTSSLAAHGHNHSSPTHNVDEASILGQNSKQVDTTQSDMDGHIVMKKNGSNRDKSIDKTPVNVYRGILDSLIEVNGVNALLREQDAITFSEFTDKSFSDVTNACNTVHNAFKQALEIRKLGIGEKNYASPEIAKINVTMKAPIFDIF